MLRIGLVGNADVHESIEIDQDAVLFLMRCVAVVFQRFEMTSYLIVLIVGCNFEWR